MRRGINAIVSRATYWSASNTSLAFRPPQSATAAFHSVDHNRPLPSRASLSRDRARSCCTWLVPTTCELWEYRSGEDVCSRRRRSEEHTSELQSRLHLVCRL